jgi:hypothetical protein
MISRAETFDYFHKFRSGVISINNDEHSQAKQVKMRFKLRNLLMKTNVSLSQNWLMRW